MPEPLSCYILTCNSQRRLEQVLRSVAGVADEIVVVDSGSADGTGEIAARYATRILHHDFENFTAQRTYAASACSHRWVLAIDSDEVLSPALAERIQSLKQARFSTPNCPEAFAIQREWYFLGRKVHCFYPSSCPDQPVRLFDREKCFYEAGRQVHEALRGFARAELIREPLLHYTCDTADDLYGKLNQYSTLAARDLARKGIEPAWWRIVFFPWLIWYQWYLLKGGWRDGSVGLIHGRYVRDMIYQKYLKLKFDAVSSQGIGAAQRTLE